MNTPNWFVPAMTLIILVAVMVGLVYLASKTYGVIRPASPSHNATSGSTSAGSPPPQTNSTTATYGGTTLVCTWETGNDGFIFISNSSYALISINYLNITNVGTATAYVSGYRIQAYYQNGTQAFDTTIKIDAAGVYSSMPVPKYVPFTLSPGQSMSGNVFNERATDQHINQVGTAGNNVFASYTITPVWSNTPED